MRTLIVRILALSAVLAMCPAGASAQPPSPQASAPQGTTPAPSGAAMICGNALTPPATLPPVSSGRVSYMLPPCSHHQVSVPLLEPPPSHASTIAKPLVHARTRELAIARMQRSLEMMVVEGIKTTIPLHQAIMADENFQIGNFSTKFMEEFKY